MQFHNGKVMACLDPGRLGRHQTSKDKARPESGFLPAPTVPELTPQQRQALAVVSEVASKYRFRLDMRTGDMVFINNWALLHARDAYVDPGAGGEGRRHLVRLWLRNEELGWSVPAAMLAPWEAAFGSGGKGGLLVSSRKGRVAGVKALVRKYPVVPMPNYKVPRYSSGSAAYVIDDDSSDDGFESGGDEV
jgi:hypothetical protein